MITLFLGLLKNSGGEDAPSKSSVACDPTLFFHSHVSLNFLWVSGPNRDSKFQQEQEITKKERERKGYAAGFRQSRIYQYLEIKTSFS